MDAQSVAKRRAEYDLPPTSAPARTPAAATPEEKQAAREAVAREIDQIASLFSRGWGEHEIRATLNISRKRFDHRLRKMRKTALDAPMVWAKFVSGASQDMKRLYYIYTLAMAETGVGGVSKPRYSTALDALGKMHDVRCSMVHMGQSLGVYQKDAEEFGVGWPELTMALLMSTTSRGGVDSLPSGNLHRDPPADLATLPAVVRDAMQAGDIEDGEMVEEFLPEDLEAVASK